MLQIPECDLKALRHWAVDVPAVVNVYVFGSRVKGTALPDSDLDVAVKLDCPDGEELAEYIEKSSNWEEYLQSLMICRLHFHFYDPSRIDDRVVQGCQTASICVFSRDNADE